MQPPSGDGDTLADSAVALPAADAGDSLPTVDRANYQIEREVARGGMGRIFTARDRRLDREVAVKEVLSREAAYLQRFAREVRLTARLQHPGIVSLYEAGRWPTGESFYAMRLIAGRPLEAVIAEATTLDARLALVPHVLAIAEALAYAHAQRIIHRDLKPANVLVGTFGEIVVIDWGLAKDLAAGDSEPEPYAEPTAGDAALTQLGAILGTPSYMPLEQATGRAVDERADVYAIGAILYHVLSGALPYHGTTGMEIVQSLIEGPPAALAARQPGVPADLLAIVARAMARDVSARYPSAKALADDLRRYQSGQLVASHHYSRREHLRRWLRRHRGAVAVAALALLVVIGGGVASYVRIVREATRADGERQAAIARADALTIEQARRALITDPTVALAWLRELPDDSALVPVAESIAIDAESREVATILASGDASIRALATRGDGKLLVAGDVDGVLRAYDLPSGHVRELGHLSGAISQIAMSTDGTRAMVIAGRTVQLWNLTDGTAVTEPTAADGRPRAVAISADGALVAWDNGDNETVMCELATARCGRLPEPALGLGFSADGTRLVAVSDGAITTYDLPDLNGHDRRAVLPHSLDPVVPEVRGNAFVLYGAHELASISGKGVMHGDREEATTPGAFADQLVVSADGTWFAISGLRGIEAWHDGAKHTEVADAGAAAMALAPHRPLLAIAYGGGLVELVDLVTGMRRALRGHRSTVSALEFAEDGAVLVTAGDDGELRRWPIATAMVIDDAHMRIPSMVPSRSGELLASGAFAVPGPQHLDTYLLLARRTDGTFARVPAGELYRLAVSDDGLVAGLVTYQSTYGLWWIATGEVVRSDLEVTHSSERGFSLTGGTLEVRTLRDHALVWSTKHVGEVVRLSPDLMKCAMPAGPTQLAIRGPGLDHVLELGLHPWLVRWSRDGRWLAVADDAGALRICNVETWACRADLHDDGPIEQLALTDDGGLVVTASRDGTVRLAHTATGKSEVVHRGPRTLDLQISRDETALVLRDYESEVWIRDLKTGDERTLPRLFQQVAGVGVTDDAVVLVEPTGQVASVPRRMPPGTSLRALLEKLTNARVDAHGRLVDPQRY